jgi:hypothetical protein
MGYKTANFPQSSDIASISKFVFYLDLIDVWLNALCFLVAIKKRSWG